MAKKTSSDDITCTICLELLIKPKVLPCCHTFCEKCLEGIVEKNKKKLTLSCLQCRVEHKVPANGVSGFLDDYTIVIPEVHALGSPNAKHTVQLCESCDKKGKAVAYCHDCESYLCQSCLDSHKTIKFLKGHRLEDTISQLQGGHVSLKKARTIHCSLHPHKELELYCLSCECMACVLCVVASHNEHKLGNISSDTRQKMQAQIEEYMSQVQQKLAGLEDNLVLIKEIEEDKSKEQAQLQVEINKSCDSLVAKIEAQRACLLSEVETAFSKDLKELWAQKELVETAIAASRGALSFANRSLPCTSDLEFLLVGAQLKCRLKELKEKHWDPTLVADIEVMSRQFSPNSALDVSAIGKIQTLQSPIASSLSIQELPPMFVAQLGQPVKIKIKAFWQSPRKLQASPQLTAVRILHGKNRVEVPHPPTVAAIASEVEKKAWFVTFIPVVSGPHTIRVETKSNGIGEKTLTVAGEPEIGARVMRGPDWSYNNEDKYAGNHGTVSSSVGDTRYRFKVKWDGGQSENSYKWGNEQTYDLQLVL